jgi:hypothetical protein
MIRNFGVGQSVRLVRAWLWLEIINVDRFETAGSFLFLSEPLIFGGHQDEALADALVMHGLSDQPTVLSPHLKRRRVQEQSMHVPPPEP